MSDQPHESDAYRAATATAVLRCLREAGHVAYFAGGCVRDRLLGIDPSDYDVATSADPAAVRKLFAKTQSVGAAFGVILVRLGGDVIEVATFRTDGKYRDGRRPETVIFSTPADDAQRRDFTVNGMFYDPIDDQVIDFVGGQADLRGKVLRAIGNPDERFAEDQLRLLRAVRFAARFDLAIDPATAEAIKRHAPALTRISPERIADELRRMLMPATRGTAVLHLRALGLLPQLLRVFKTEVGDNELIPALACVHSGVISFGLALAVLVLDTRSPGTEAGLLPCLEPIDIRRTTLAMRQSLKLSNEELDAMAGALDVGHLLHAEFPRVATLKRFLARPTAGDATLLLRSLCHAGFFATRITELLQQFESLATEDVAPPPLVTGDDLAAAGMTPGPSFKRALDGAYDAQLEGEVSSHAAALERAIKLLR